MNHQTKGVKAMRTLLTSVFAGILVIGLGAFSLAQNPQSSAQGQNSFFTTCPWHNTHSTMMGPNMMAPMMMQDHCGPFMGNSMMGSYYMNSNYAAICPWDVAEFNVWRQRMNISTPLSKTSAKQWAEYYVAAYQNPNLVIGNITEKNNGFEVEIRNKKDNRVIEKIFINKHNGWVSRIK